MLPAVASIVTDVPWTLETTTPPEASSATSPAVDWSDEPFAIVTLPEVAVTVMSSVPVSFKPPVALPTTKATLTAEMFCSSPDSTISLTVSAESALISILPPASPP